MPRYQSSIPWVLRWPLPTIRLEANQSLTKLLNQFHQPLLLTARCQCWTTKSKFSTTCKLLGGGRGGCTARARLKTALARCRLSGGPDLVEWPTQRWTNKFLRVFKALPCRAGGRKRSSRVQGRDVGHWPMTSMARWQRQTMTSECSPYAHAAWDSVCETIALLLAFLL